MEKSKKAHYFVDKSSSSILRLAFVRLFSKHGPDTAKRFLYSPLQHQMCNFLHLCQILGWLLILARISSSMLSITSSRAFLFLYSVEHSETYTHFIRWTPYVVFVNSIWQENHVVLSHFNLVYKNARPHAKVWLLILIGMLFYI